MLNVCIEVPTKNDILPGPTQSLLFPDAKNGR